MPPTCRVHRAVDLVGSRWTLLIIHQLCTTARGFNELLRSIDGINPRTLSLRLKELVAHHLVTKTALPTTPVRVEYALTAEGAQLKGIINRLGDWAAALPEGVTGSR